MVYEQLLDGTLHQHALNTRELIQEGRTGDPRSECPLDEFTLETDALIEYTLTGEGRELTLEEEQDMGCHQGRSLPNVAFCLWAVMCLFYRRR